MLELLAAIQSADPPSLVLWSLFVFAAGMYPVGFMLGSTCSPCCGAPPCSQCTTGELPDTVTVTFDGFTDQSPGPDLTSLSFSACFGGGASARVTAPGGDPATDKGPISAVSLTNSGSGYAKLGRVAPTLTISGGGGTGATFTPTLTSADDSCGVPSWSLSAVAFKDGTGYADGEQLSVTEAGGDTVVSVAVVRVQTTRTQPTLSASASGGSGATLTVTTASNGDTPQTWGVSGVSVSGTTASYADMTKIAFTGTGVVEQTAADAYIRTIRVQPTPTLTVQSLGSGAGLTATLTEINDPGEWPARPAWEVSSIAITAGGTGYSVYDTIECTTDGQGSLYSWFYAYVEEVDENGAILAVTLYGGGAFFKSTGEIDEVQILSGGAYYHDDGIPTGVTVENGGQYYREDASEPPYVASVTVTVASQQLPSAGTGATFSATVDDDTSSPTFGKITGLEIENGGTGYLAWKWIANACCGWQLNGMPIVLKRGGENQGPCRYWHRMCGGWGGRSFGNMTRYANGVMGIAVYYNGPSAPPTVRIVRTGVIVPGAVGSDDIEPLCAVTMTAEDLITDCNDFSFSAETIAGITATVAPGGDYDENFKGKHGSASVPYTRCTKCCQGADDIPQEIEVEVTDRGYYGGDKSGVYVLPLTGSGWGFSIPQNELWTVRFNVSVAIGEGMCGSQEGCDQCVKQCEITAECSYSYHPQVWYAPADQDMRRCFDPNDTEQERIAQYCSRFCFDVPLCSPPAGMEFSFYQMSGSENWSDSVFLNEQKLCEPNDDPTWQDGDPWEGPYTGPPRPDHLNTFKLKVL